jgi:hypothetical protein
MTPSACHPATTTQQNTHCEKHRTKLLLTTAPPTMEPAPTARPSTHYFPKTRTLHPPATRSASTRSTVTLYRKPPDGSPKPNLFTAAKTQCPTGTRPTTAKDFYAPTPHPHPPAQPSAPKTSKPRFPNVPPRNTRPLTRALPLEKPPPFPRTSPWYKLLPSHCITSPQAPKPTTPKTPRLKPPATSTHLLAPKQFILHKASQFSASCSFCNAPSPTSPPSLHYPLKSKTQTSVPSFPSPPCSPKQKNDPLLSKLDRRKSTRSKKLKVRNFPQPLAYLLIACSFAFLHPH